MKTIIRNATVVNEGERFEASVLISDGIIERIERNGDIDQPNASVVDAKGAFLLPGAIDDHVHMRDPGLTHKATMESETAAAAAGGVTSVLDMPNVLPQTTTIALVNERHKLAKGKCHVNYAFYLGATSNNIEEVLRADEPHIPGVKLFMGSSTGNMLVDNEQGLRRIFRECPTILMTHCESSERINRRTKEVQKEFGEDPDITHHPEIRDEEACYQSTALAVQLAKESGTRLHVAHLSTARELDLFSPENPHITAEACVPHLIFTQDDYHTLGTRIKCNPSIKRKEDRDALRKALNDGRISLIATDHAPHLLREKQGGCVKAVSGMPMIQFSLPAMLTLADEGILNIERVVELMCHAPARVFGIKQRGFIREGYKADLVLVRPTLHTVTDQEVKSICGWTPLNEKTLNWSVEHTWVNGQLAWDGKHVNAGTWGEALEFERH